MLFIFLSGFAGGAIRGMTGFIKHQFSYKDVPFRLKYFAGMMILSGLIGAVVVMAIQNLGFTYHESFSWALAMIVGYAGGDFIENIYKIIIQKSSLLSEDKK
jgi:uncharacterized membrane protein YeaQ/YmgE (transglycosylase-associated protein family)